MTRTKKSWKPLAFGFMDVSLLLFFLLFHQGLFDICYFLSSAHFGLIWLLFLVSWGGNWGHWLSNFLIMGVQCHQFSSKSCFSYHPLYTMFHFFIRFKLVNFSFDFFYSMHELFRTVLVSKHLGIFQRTHSCWFLWTENRRRVILILYIYWNLFYGPNTLWIFCVHSERMCSDIVWGECCVNAP